MEKVLMLSVLIAAVAVPAVAAREPSARRGLRKALLYTLAFDVAYAIYLTALHTST